MHYNLRVLTNGELVGLGKAKQPRHKRTKKSQPEGDESDENGRKARSKGGWCCLLILISGIQVYIQLYNDFRYPDRCVFLSYCQWFMSVQVPGLLHTDIDL